MTIAASGWHSRQIGGFSPSGEIDPLRPRDGDGASRSPDRNRRSVRRRQLPVDLGSLRIAIWNDSIDIDQPGTCLHA